MENGVEMNGGRRDHGTMIALGTQKELESNQINQREGELLRKVKERVQRFEI